MPETPLDIVAAAQLIAARKLSPVELVRAVLDRIEHVEPRVHAYARFCVGWNVTGMPALSVPCGYDAAGLSIGLQIAARRDRDSTVLSIGRAFQSVTDFHLAVAPV